MTLLWLALLPWLAAPLVLALPGRRSAAAMAGAVALAGVCFLLVLAPAVFAGEVPAWRMSWVPQLGWTLGCAWMVWHGCWRC